MEKEKIDNIINGIKSILKTKNANYGNAAMVPLNAFYKGNSATSISIRIDDKIQRILNSEKKRKNDIVDLLGYIILFTISKYLKVSWTSDKEKDKEIFSESVDKACDLLFSTLGFYYMTYEKYRKESDACDELFDNLFGLSIMEIKQKEKVTFSDLSNIIILLVMTLMYNDWTDFNDLID